MKAMILLLATTALCWLWLWFMIARPQQWSRLVDKENDFFLRLGLVSASLSERARRFEKGLGAKMLVGFAAIIGTVALLVVQFLISKHVHK